MFNATHRSAAGSGAASSATPPSPSSSWTSAASTTAVADPEDPTFDFEHAQWEFPDELNRALRLVQRRAVNAKSSLARWQNQVRKQHTTVLNVLDAVGKFHRNDKARTLLIGSERKSIASKATLTRSCSRKKRAVTESLSDLQTAVAKRFRRE